jgi:hypothetical protein
MSCTVADRLAPESMRPRHVSAIFFFVGNQVEITEVYFKTDPGYIYILSNKAMPGIFKIGRSIKGGQARAKEIYRQGGTGVPAPFKLEFEVFSNYHSAHEKIIHEKLADFRINRAREFFEINICRAVECVLGAVVENEFGLHVGDSGSLVTKEQLIHSYGKQTEKLIKDLYPNDDDQAFHLANALADSIDIYSVINAIHKEKEFFDHCVNSSINLRDRIGVEA